MRRNTLIIKEVLEELLNSDINKAEKLALLNRNVLGDQYIRQLNIAAFREILKFMELSLMRIFIYFNDLVD